VARVLALCGRLQFVYDPQTSRPLVGIDPIKGVLGREVVSPNRRAMDRLWLTRHARYSLGSVGRGIGRWKPRSRIAERQRTSDAAREGHAPPAERRRELATR
jgi:hypothetical protein